MLNFLLGQVAFLLSRLELSSPPHWMVVGERARVCPREHVAQGRQVKVNGRIGTPLRFALLAIPVYILWRHGLNERVAKVLSERFCRDDFTLIGAWFLIVIGVL